MASNKAKTPLINKRLGQTTISCLENESIMLHKNILTEIKPSQITCAHTHTHIFIHDSK